MQRSTSFFRWLAAWLLLSLLGVGILGGASLSVRAAPKQQAQSRDVIINEVAWGGTIASSETDEWIELFNTSSTPIDFNGEWLLISEGTPPKINITLTGSIGTGNNGYYLLERQNDSVINTIPADQIYLGPGNLLDDEGDTLSLYAPDGAGDYILIDTLNINGGKWPAGSATGYGSMERYGNYEDSDSIWVTNSNPDLNNQDFRGNPIYGTPRAENWAFTITPITTTTITSDSPDPSIPNTPVKVTVSVTGGPTPPEGKVNVTGGTKSCTITLNNGVGNCNLTFTSLGQKIITAKYNPSSNHTKSEDTEEHDVIDGIQTTTTITKLNPEPGTVDENILVSVKVDPSSGSTKPTGTVRITGANTNCQLTLVNGTGSCNVRFNSIGVKTLTATYDGEDVFIPSKTSTTIDIFLASETTITSDNPDPSNRNQSVSVNVTVTGDDVTPTGNVEITGATSNCTITLSDGTGSCNVSFSSSGTKTIRATYIGDDLYGKSSDTASHTVSFSSGGSSSGSSGTVVLPPILGISEFLPRPGYDWNNDGFVDVFDEFIEIINAGQIDVNLSSYRLDDEQNLGSVPYTLPAITLKPGERAVFFAAETGILLSDAGDTVRLLRGSSTVVDAYTYGIVRYPDHSWCRIPDRLGYWNDPCFPTPGNPNALTGNSPLPSEGLPGYLPSVCLLSDTTPDEFVYAECEVGGDEIWNRRYWDNKDDTEQVRLEEGKGEMIFE